MTQSAAQRGAIGGARIASAVARLARNASLELNGLDAPALGEAREFLWPRQRIFVSHLPGQTWDQTTRICEQVAAAGCTAVPHVPVRLLESERQLDAVLGAARGVGVEELLLISGDYAEPRGVFSDVLSVLRGGWLQSRGFARVSIAGHPEGHPAVPRADIGRAQIDKAVLGAQLGLEVSIVTQFFFEARPYVEWATGLRNAGVEARLVAGLAGPAGIVKLLGLARRCGVGPSMRAITTRPASLLKLVTEQDPGGLLESLAAAEPRRAGLLDGIHLFSFGGFHRTARWLRETAEQARS
jgi:methylenetetrahydrofolate reductase (NADPH)